MAGFRSEHATESWLTKPRASEEKGALIAFKSKPRDVSKECGVRRMIARARSADLLGELAPSSGFALRICEAWTQSIRGIIEAGRLLLEAKEVLPHGAFEDMIRRELPFGRRTAQKLMEIARNAVIANPTHESHLPRSWTTLWRLSALPEDRLEFFIANKRIDHKTERKDADRLIQEVAAEAVYNYATLCSCINQLIRFKKKYPQPTSLAYHVVDMEDDEVDLSELADLPGWLGSLHEECERQKRRAAALCDEDQDE